MRLVNRRDDQLEHTDGDLVAAAATGDERAFELLYTRHARAAWGLAMSVTGNPDDASDAVSDAFARVLRSLMTSELREPDRFRSYLLTVTRNAALDNIRKGSRLRLSDDIESFSTATAPSALDSHAAGVDARLIATAFRSLPERWRSILWLTEVEGMAARDVANLLGLTPNSASALALRARNGLRERYLQAHLGRGARRDCTFCIDHLGAYVAGRLAPRDIAKVDQHLAGCADCRAKSEELEEVGAGLRRIALPLPLLLGPAAVASWKMATGGLVASAAAAGKTSFSQLASSMVPVLQRPLLMAASGVFALGVISATVVGDANGPLTGGRVRAPIAIDPTDATPTVAADTPAEAAPIPEPSFEVPAELAAAAGTTGNGGVATDGLAQAPPAPPADITDSTPTGPPVTSPPPVKPAAATGIAATIGPLKLAVATGVGSCTGASVNGTVAGCAPAAKPPVGTAAITVSSEGTLIGPLDGKQTTVGL